MLYFTKNNGIYILLIFLPVLIWVVRKYLKRTIIVFVAVIVSYIIIQIANIAFDVKKDIVGDYLSIPLQQIARTVTDYGEDIPENDREIIASILPFEQLPEIYNPTLADPLKGWKGAFNEMAFKADSRTYISLWVRLFTKYPIAYIEAFLCHTHGYWYPDTDTGIVSRSVSENEYGIHRVNIAPAFIENIFSGIFVFRAFPVLSMLISIGFAVWITIIAAFILIMKKQRKILIAFLPVFLLWLTCIASPASGMFRYIYGLFLSLPLLISIALQSEDI
jgi:hypothetical protein